jgi:protein TonB
MFDSVLSKAPAAQRRFGLGTLSSIGAHAALVGLVAWLTASAPAETAPTLPDLKFFAASPAPRGPAAPTPAVKKAGAPAAKRSPKKALVQPAAIVAEHPPAPPPEDETDDDEERGDDEGDAQPGGLISDGDGTGSPDGDGSPGTGGGGGEEVLPFGEGMTRPECDKSVLSDLYARSREAREARVEGSLVLQCSIMANGTVQDCRALKPLPLLTDAALEAMKQMKCKPATFQGRAVSIKYVQNFQLVLPR